MMVCDQRTFGTTASNKGGDTPCSQVLSLNDLEFVLGLCLMIIPTERGLEAVCLTALVNKPGYMYFLSH